MLRHLKSQLKELHVILTCDEVIKIIIKKYFLIGFNNNKNLKPHLVKAALPDINESGRCKPYCGKRSPCQLCSNIKIQVPLKVNIQKL